MSALTAYFLTERLALDALSTIPARPEFGMLLMEFFSQGFILFRQSFIFRDNKVQKIFHPSFWPRAGRLGQKSRDVAKVFDDPIGGFLAGGNYFIQISRHDSMRQEIVEQAGKHKMPSRRLQWAGGLWTGARQGWRRQIGSGGRLGWH